MESEQKVRDEIIKRLDQKIIDIEKRIDEKDAHLRELIKNADDKLRVAQESADKAISKSEESTKTHFQSHNEFNARIEKVVSEQASKEWAVQFQKSTDERFKVLEKQSSEKEGIKKYITAGLAITVSAISIIIFFIGVVVYFASKN